MKRWKSFLTVIVAWPVVLSYSMRLDAQEIQFASTLTHANSTAELSDAALGLINSLVTADQLNFYVYKESDSGFNHGFPSGVFGPAQAKLHFDTACVYDA